MATQMPIESGEVHRSKARYSANFDGKKRKCDLWAEQSIHAIWYKWNNNSKMEKIQPKKEKSTKRRSDEIMVSICTYRELRPELVDLTNYEDRVKSWTQLLKRQSWVWEQRSEQHEWQLAQVPRNDNGSGNENVNQTLDNAKREEKRTSDPDRS